MILSEEIILEIDVRGNRSILVENSIWKSLWANQS
jgi:hypothetical protein